MRPLAPALAALLALAPVAAGAGNLVVGVGYYDFSDMNALDSPVIELELHSNPLWHFAGADWSIGGVVEHQESGDAFVGIGPSGIWPLGNRWFVEGSLMPGYFGDSGISNALGGDFQIRTLLGVGFAVSNRLSLSLAASHMSNADTASRNPGANALSLRTRWSF